MMQKTAGSSNSGLNLWLGALACFLLAALTGTLYRFGLLTGLPAGLGLVNVRHAHSHLMFLGWVTPALMGLIFFWWPRVTGRSWKRPGRLRAVVYVNIIISLATFIPFLLYGYGSAPIGGRSIPLAPMILGVDMLAWYAFIILYIGETRRGPRPLPVLLWDVSLALMVLASIGAWGVTLVGRLGLEDPFWSAAATRLFLDTFADGWFLFACLGLLYAVYPAAGRAANLDKALAAISLGAPFLFLLNLSFNIVPPETRWLASAAGLLFVAGLVGLLIPLWRVTPLPVRSALFFLGLKGLVVLALLLPVSARWVSSSGLRLSILHWHLLGFVTLALVWVAHQSWGVLGSNRWRPLWLTVFLLILTLIPLSALWPAAWQGLWTQQAAAWATLGPLLAGGIIWFKAFSRRQGK